MRLLILSLLSALLLTGCTAVELLENHTSSAYGWGEDYEKGYVSPHGEKYNVPQNYAKAYERYLIADRLGDIRARKKINLLSSKISSEQRTSVEEKVNNMSLREMKKFYNVPYKYDRNRQTR